MRAVARVAAIGLVTVALAAGLAACGSGGETTTAEAPAHAAEQPIERYFAARSPWNTPAQSLPASPRSSRMLALARRRQAVIEVPGQPGVKVAERVVRRGLRINTLRWAPLIVRAGGEHAVTTKLVCRQRDCGTDGEQVPAVLALPAGTRPDPRYDGWLSVIDPAKGVGYDFWRARRQTGNTISYQYAKAWALDGPGFSAPVSEDPARAAGARGSGLPLFAGVIGPAELRAGEIDHALAISVPGLARRNYVQPASVTDGVGPVNSVPAGARLRLAAHVRPRSKPGGDWRTGEEAILVALRRYGAIVVDRAASPTLYAAQGTPPGLLREDLLSWLRLSDFEVVALPPLHHDPPLGANQVVVSATAPPGGGG